jgi:hypothetical protein
VSSPYVSSLEVLGLNLYLVTDSPDHYFALPYFLKANAGVVLNLDEGYLRAHPFEFVIPPSVCNTSY